MKGIGVRQLFPVQCVPRDQWYCPKTRVKTRDATQFHEILIVGLFGICSCFLWSPAAAEIWVLDSRPKWLKDKGWVLIFNLENRTAKDVRLVASDLPWGASGIQFCWLRYRLSRIA